MAGPAENRIEHKDKTVPPTIEDYRLRLASLAVGPTTLRNQGAPGVAEAARDFLTKIDLTRFISDSETAFTQELDQQTESLIKSLPKGAQNWGTARKAINLFLGEAYYHRFVCKAYELERVEQFLELPLDSQVGHFLTKQARKAGEVNFPRWHSIKYLSPPISRRYQEFASGFAKSIGQDWARIHLDVIIWRRV